MRIFSKRNRYSISPDREDWVTPEETLVDSTSSMADIELPVGDSLWRAAVWLVAIVAFVLIGGSARLAVGRYDELAQLAWRNRTVNVSVPPPRGIIMDRNGMPLVQNAPSFDLLVISRQLDRNADGTLRDVQRVADVLERNVEEMTLAINDQARMNAVFFLATDVNREQVLSLKDALPNGFYLITSTKRQYEDGSQFSHLLGYVGKVSKADMAGDAYYLPSDTIGRLGIEATYEDTLRGTHGELEFSGGDQPAARPAQPGANVVLNVDAAVQQALWQAVWDVLRESGLSQASAIAQDPQSGAVLGMVSFPTYDNNLFSRPLSQADADELFSGRTRPLFNRTIAGLYNPGSTIKPFIGMAALEEGIVRPDQWVTDDCIAISIPNPSDPTNPYVFDNWRRDLGAFDLNRAIAQSCNVYFFTVGGGHGGITGLGAERIARYLKDASADSLLGIDLPGEEQGFIPTPAWKYASKKEPWYQGDTYNISIGQGDLLLTPLWINAYTAAIANGGTLWVPQVVARIVDEQKETLQVRQPEALGRLPFSAGVIERMQVAMRETVLTGTARLLGDIGVTAAAKTGTAEVIKGRRINSLLTVYAPAENPRVALTVLIEGSAENQGYALRVARQFLRWYFNPDATPAPSPATSPSPSVSVLPAPIASTSPGF